MIKTEEFNWKDLVFGLPCTLPICIKGDNRETIALFHCSEMLQENTLDMMPSQI